MPDPIIFRVQPRTLTFVLKPGTGGASIGGGGVGFDFTQPVAAAVWTINHNLGRRPVVALHTVGGVELTGAITHLSVNTVQINFNTPRTGTARCI